MTDDHLSETRIDSTVHFEGRLVRIEVDRVRLADGNESRREVVRHGGAVVVVPVTDDGRLLLVRQFRYPTGEVLLELPAGTLEANEDPAECAHRELEEETGHRAGGLKRVGEFYSAPGFCDELLYCFVATGLQPDGEAEGDADERIEVGAIPIDDLAALIVNGEIRDAKTLAALMLARVHGAL